jgi:hypothetical protein
MTNDAILIVVATTVVAALIGGVARYHNPARLLRVLFFLWCVLSVVLLVLALVGVPFDRQVFVILWSYFALPALAGGVSGVWIVRKISGRGHS